MGQFCVLRPNKSFLDPFVRDPASILNKKKMRPFVLIIVLFQIYIHTQTPIFRWIDGTYFFVLYLPTLYRFFIKHRLCQVVSQQWWLLFDFFSICWHLIVPNELLFWFRSKNKYPSVDKFHYQSVHYRCFPFLYFQTRFDLKLETSFFFSVSRNNVRIVFSLYCL